MENKIKGFYNYDSVDCRKINYLFSKLKNRLRVKGYRQLSFPRVGLYADFKKEKDHFELNSEVFRLEDERYYLSATGESIMYPIVYEDKSTVYPIKWYDIGPVWRNESKVTKKYFRCKQINYFFETHAIYTKEEESKKAFNEWIVELKKFFEQIGLSKISVVKRPEDDKFKGAEETIAFDYTLDGQTYQLASIHYLGSNFNDAYNEMGYKTYGYCWGVTERLLGLLKLVYKEKYDSLFEDRPLLVYYKDSIELEELVSNNKYDRLTLAYVKLNEFNSKNFMQQEKLWSPVFTLKIGSLEELHKDDLWCRFIPYKKDISIKKMEELYESYLSETLMCE